MIIDLFGGPGGWAEGLRMLGLDEIGVELDPWACATRRAAGHRVIRADVASYPTGHLAGRVEGLIASPPCQMFSAAGNGEGRALLLQLCADVKDGRYNACDCCYPSGVRHVLELGRWAEAIRPRWVAAEQVPPVLPLWQAYARRLRTLGYSAWAGILNAANYGVPQTRKRAILMASLDRPVAAPAWTHSCGTGASTLFGRLHPWVSMAEALGWTGEGVDRPARTVAGHRAPRWLYPDPDGSHGDIVVLNRRQQTNGVPVPPVPSDRPAPTLTGIAGAKSQWVWERPATTVAGDPRITARCHHDEGSQGADAKTTDQVQAGEYEGTEPIRLTLTEALVLQSFRPDYPVQGTKTAQFRQCGDAMPPRLAAHVLAAVTGRAFTAEAAA